MASNVALQPATAQTGGGPFQFAHGVHFYERDSFLIDSFGFLSAEGLSAGESVVLIMTPAHLAGLERYLSSRVNLSAMRGRGELVTMDAAEALSGFMVKGWPDASAFRRLIGGVIEEAGRHSPKHLVRAFGEMVSILVEEGRGAAAVLLEQLWNELSRELAFSLRCAYTLAGFAGDREGALFGQVCAEHSAVAPAEGYAELATEARTRSVAWLQHKANLLRGVDAERASLEEQLRDKVEYLAAMNQRKDAFLALLGHELRNPLAAVSNAVLSAQRDPRRGERALEIAARQTEHLSRLIDELLDAARITQGQIVLKRTPLLIGEFVAHVVERMRSVCVGRNQTLTLEIAPGAEQLKVEADQTRLQQIVDNVLENAAKYTPQGGRIEVKLREFAGEVLLAVRDSGSGIAAKDLSRIFDLFTQAERPTDAGGGGLGIGLALVKHLCELHGGGVSAHSDGLGRGSEFTVRLPKVDRALIEEAVTLEAPAPARLPILLVEDNPDGAESLRMLLEVLGHEVHAVGDGNAALQTIAERSFSLALIDIGLPGMDGCELARRIRETTAAQIVLAALTGYGQESDRERSRAAGFDYHLVKPLRIDVLKELLNQSREKFERAVLSSASKR